MSLYIVFDTNYLRSLPSKDYVEGKIPPRFIEQLEIAFKRGDIVAIPRTVQIEINAWIQELAERELNNIRQAAELLKNKGYSVTPGINEVVAPIDVFRLLKLKFPDLYLLEPTIEDYMEAERRASYKLPPLPKNKEGEEFRDRIIWSQLLNISKITDLPIVIVSGDAIFENGANSDEGVKANIQVVKTEEDLNQRLDKRPPAIQKIINDILLFREQLKEKKINIEEYSIKRIEDYRAHKDEHGTEIKTFTLAIDESTGLPSRMSGKITYRGNIPVLLNLRWDTNEVEILRQLNQKELLDSTIKQQELAWHRKNLESELKHLLQG
jgi:hypothetical protein